MKTTFGMGIGSLVLLLAAGACSTPVERFCETTADCDKDPRYTFCDVEGEYPASEGVGKMCIPDPFEDEVEDELCAPDTFVQCSSETDAAIYCNGDGSELVTVECDAECSVELQGCYCEPSTSSCSADTTLHCGAEGEIVEVESCALGCDAGGERCVDVNPSNELGGYLDMTDDAPIVVLTDGAVIDTDAGTIENGDGSVVTVPSFQVTAKADGVAVRVFAVKSLAVADTMVVGDRALAIVADEEIRVAGNLRVLSGSLSTTSCAGDEGGVVETGGQVGEFNGVRSGGGGGGFGARGGDGGDASGSGKSVAGGNGGQAAGSPFLIPLRGGCRGGNYSDYWVGGEGGGAIQLVSRSLVVLEAGGPSPFINANGQGGGRVSGGGSGGGILVEAPKVVVPSGTGIIANGGAGGCSVTNGADGSLDETAAQGPTCYSIDGGDGGARTNSEGGDGDTFVGGSEQAVNGSAGGGGGGVGRIRINVPVPSDFGEFGVVSPEPSIGTLQTR